MKSARLVRIEGLEIIRDRGWTRASMERAKALIEKFSVMSDDEYDRHMEDLEEKYVKEGLDR